MAARQQSIDVHPEGLSPRVELVRLDCLQRVISRVVAQKIERAEGLHRGVDGQHRALLGTDVRFDDPDAIAEFRQRSLRTRAGLRITIDGDD
jgi:hypothetical protein